MFERFTEDARRTVVLAQDEARLARYRSIGPEQILVALAHGESMADLLPPLEILRTSLESIDADALSRIGFPISPELVREVQPVNRGHIPFTGPAKEVLEGALRSAISHRHKIITSFHILDSLLRLRENSVPIRMLGATVGDLGLLRVKLDTALKAVA